MHLDKFKCLKEFKNWQLDNVNKVSLDKSVQLKSKNYKFLTDDDFNSYVKYFSENLHPSKERYLK